jgi:hypothetical protein
VIVITGIALLGTISAFLASFLMDPSGKRDAEILKDSEKANATIYDLLSEVKALRAEVQALSGVSLAKKPEPSQGVTVKKATSAKKPVSKK